MQIITIYLSDNEYTLPANYTIHQAEMLDFKECFNQPCKTWFTDVSRDGCCQRSFSLAAHILCYSQSIFSSEVHSAGLKAIDAEEITYQYWTLHIQTIESTIQFITTLKERILK